MIKVVVSDLDGTLLKHNDVISDKNLKALNYAKDKGVEFIAATGRDYLSLRSVFDQYNIRCKGILGNGAQFVDEDGHIIKSEYFPKHLFLKVVHIFDQFNIHYMIFTNNGFYTMHEPNVVQEAFIQRCIKRFGNTRESFEEKKTIMPCMNLKKIDDIDAFLKSSIDIIKIEAFDQDCLLIEKAKEQLQMIDDIAYLSSFIDNVEVTSIRAQKGFILEDVIGQLGYTKNEVMVLGDGMNDITLFECFPYSFALANAQEEIKRLAYHIVSSCENDGVSEAIYMMISNQGGEL